MAFLKSKPAPSAPYSVPSMAEADDVYAGLLTKRAELSGRQAALHRERRDLEKAIAADTSREVRPAIAELLGDEPGTKAINRRRLAEVKADVADIDVAFAVLEQRIRDAKTPAVRKVVALVRPEFDRRMGALCDALKVAEAAHQEFAELCSDLEAEDVSPAHLGPVPYFLGSAGDGRIKSFLTEARHG